MVQKNAPFCEFFLTVTFFSRNDSSNLRLIVYARTPPFKTLSTGVHHLSHPLETGVVIAVAARIRPTVESADEVSLQFATAYDMRIGSDIVSPTVSSLSPVMSVASRGPFIGPSLAVAPAWSPSPLPGSAIAVAPVSPTTVFPHRSLSFHTAVVTPSVLTSRKPMPRFVSVFLVHV